MNEMPLNELPYKPSDIWELKLEVWFNVFQINGLLFSHFFPLLVLTHKQKFSF